MRELTFNFLDILVASNLRVEKIVNELPVTISLLKTLAVAFNMAGAVKQDMGKIVEHTPQCIH